MSADFVIAECGLRLAIDDWRHNPKSPISIGQQQSTNPQSSIRTPQSI
jgi:hypothetical protein